ncbi:MAG: DUF2309 domain-containing protein [Pirellulales bacterium]
MSELKVEGSLDHASHGATSHDSVQHTIEHALEHATHFLPSQGPIAVFVHHNTLHAFEDLPFAEAARSALGIFGSQPYLSEQRYRDELRGGRIEQLDLAFVLDDELAERGAETVAPNTSRRDLRLAMLLHPIRTAPGAELRWLVTETDALRRFRDDVEPTVAARMVDDTRRWINRDYVHRTTSATSTAKEPTSHPADAPHQPTVVSLLEQFGSKRIESWSNTDWHAFTLNLLWRVCQHGARVGGKPQEPLHAYQRPRDYLVKAAAIDPDLKANDLLIRYAASFLDQGFAPWSLPDRDAGFYHAFIKLFEQESFLELGLLQRIRALTASEHRDGLSAMESIRRSLDAFGISEHDIPAFVERSLLALPGWAGMVWQMETNADWTIRPAPRGSLEGFLAVRLLIDRAAAEEAAEELFGRQISAKEIAARLQAQSHRHDQDQHVQRSFVIFQAAQLLGWSPESLLALDGEGWKKLVHELEDFGPLARRRVFQFAYEHHYTSAALGAITQRAHEGLETVEKPKFQVMCCIDDREESFRRHLEEIDPRVETFGAAGFFSVAMYFRGAADAHFVPLCPVVVKPQHYVEETSVLSFLDLERRRAETRRAIGHASHQVHLGSRGLIGGSLTALAGSLASIPLVARVLFPGLTAQVRSTFGRFVQPPRVTQLHIERVEEKPGPDGGHRGFTLQEMASIVERLLADTGLRRLSPLVIILGHGSSSLNNPHESAYNCGACGGGRGGPNARALAQMANDARVRALLAERGLTIPADTTFVGGFHNTCDDSVIFFDLERLPPHQAALFEEARDIIDEARQRNAHERVRRFESAALSISQRDALRHVEIRAEDLAQARPEYNHATNAMCVVGRRARTRGLFLDRRSFLTSYDPTTDDAQFTILNRILQAVVPVCGGISLEYYFSCVDPAGYGCGSKLPHNITSLIGVMEGAASDLRTGLSNQMTEIHEPLRLLFVIETVPEALLSIMQRNPNIDRFVRNEWTQFAVLDPNSPVIHYYRHGRFELFEPGPSPLPNVTRSVDWYRGRREHLGFARITNETSGQA